MTQTTRADRERLIQRDDGDAEETVIIKQAGSRGSRSHYHADNGDGETDCPHGPEDGLERARGWAHSRELPPCTRCVLGGGASSENGDTETECPLCGESVKSLPNHLRHNCVENE